METGSQTQRIRIDGMTCINCQIRIEKKLKSMAGVEDASVRLETGTASVTYTAPASLSGIIAAVESLGYKVSEGKSRLPHIAGTLVLILAVFVLLRALSGLAAFPAARSGMGYGMMFLIGLVTSVHCIAMCGGINLLAGGWGISGDRVSFDAAEGSHPPLASSLFPSILYNAGRLISYTAVGVAAGTLGSVITVPGRFQGAALVCAGIFMVIMGITMAGLFPSLRRFLPRMPVKLHRSAAAFFAKKSGRGPLITGFLNGFMPCGPLQAMQLYALSTGSPVRGGVSMFLFCAGTIPLMFALGAAGGIVSRIKGPSFSRRVMRIGAVLIAAMGLTMAANGWNLAGFSSPLDRIASVFNPAKTGFIPVIQDGAQIIDSTLLPNRYPAIVVQQGIPVRWTINAPPGSINGCNDVLIIREYGIEYAFKPGANVIEFLPEKTGKFPYSCWMGMIRSSITVVAEGESAGVEPAVVPVPAGVEIPTDTIAVARVEENFQTVEIRLTDNGFEPAIVVMQRQIPALWIITIDSPDPGNDSLIFPAYYAILKTKQGDNHIQLLPGDSFEFSTGDNVFYGYVKVVDDITGVDIEAVKAEAADHETLIYPEGYFETPQGGCCQ